MGSGWARTTGGGHILNAVTGRLGQRVIAAVAAGLLQKLRYVTITWDKDWLQMRVASLCSDATCACPFPQHCTWDSWDLTEQVSIYRLTHSTSSYISHKMVMAWKKCTACTILQFTIYILHSPYLSTLNFFFSSNIFPTTTGIIVTVAVLDSGFLKVVEVTCFSVVTRGIVFVYSFRIAVAWLE